MQVSRLEEIEALQEEILAASKQLAKKLVILDSLLDEALDPLLKDQGLPVKYEYKQKGSYHLLKVKSAGKIHGYLYVPCYLKVLPKKLLLLKAEESNQD